MKTSDRVSSFANDAADRIANAGHQAQDAIDEKSEQFIHAEQEMVKNCRSYVRDNPVTSLGIAAVGGFILSRLLSGR